MSVNYFRIKQVSIEFYRVNTRSLIYFQYCLNSYVSIRKVNGGIYWYLITSMVFDVATRLSSGGMEDVKRFSFIRRIWFHRIRKIRNTRWFKVIELWSNQYKPVYNMSRDEAFQNLPESSYLTTSSKKTDSSLINFSSLFPHLLPLA